MRREGNVYHLHIYLICLLIDHNLFCPSQQPISQCALYTIARNN
jgi:hypothetical protein